MKIVEIKASWKLAPRTLTACLAILTLGLMIRAGDIPGKDQSIEFVQKLQTPGGGFLSMSPAPNIRLAPTRRATSTAGRALHYLGGKLPNPEAVSRAPDPGSYWQVIA